MFVQAGPVVNVYMPKDRVSNAHQGYAFVEYRGEEDADYAIKVLNMIKLFGKPIRANKASVDKKSNDDRRQPVRRQPGSGHGREAPV